MGHNLAGPDAGSNRGGGGKVAEGDRAAQMAAAAAAAAVAKGYEHWRTGFGELTRRAFERFECRDWHGAADDATERLHLYKHWQDTSVSAMPEVLGDLLLDTSIWSAARRYYTAAYTGRPDLELAQTFFNSVTRRVLRTVGVNAGVEYTKSSATNTSDHTADSSLYRRYTLDTIDPATIERVLRVMPWSVPYAQLERDAALVAQIIRDHLLTAIDAPRSIVLDVLSPVFFRNKGAYVVGRILAGGRVVPLVLPLLHAERGIVVDAVLMTENEASIVFGFSWSYFRVDTEEPRALVEFLRSIMPRKRVDELYNAIGYHKHGKTELYRTLMRHLDDSDAQFALAEGEEGLVMAVFTLPSLNVVFKVIKDSFAAPKNTTRQRVMDQYHFVFVRDRVGRLADAQEFAQLEFPKRCFPPELLAYLLRVAGRTVRVADDRVVIAHAYTERRVIPLNLFVRDADPDATRDALLDFGNAIKELAGSDIFAGDMLLKNFGSSRHGRVICYDYDELCLLSECRFRHIPKAPSLEEELAAEPWFPIGEHDVFPEEFSTFLVPSGPVRDAFLAAHGDLLRVEYWQSIQQALAAGEMFDVFPYTRSARLQRGRSGP